MGKIQIGTQGWNYEDWVGSFYPRPARAADFLALYQKVFETVEVDSTFYAIPSAGSVHSWRERAAAGFTYSLKLPQQITHQERLQNCAETLAQFCDRARELGEKLGAILIQLPPDFSPRSWAALEKFVPLLPADLHFAVEFRDRAWLTGATGERVLELFAAHRVALALLDSKWIPRELSFVLSERPTADFAYLRWLGTRELTDHSRVQINRDLELAAWAEVAQRLSEHVEHLYCYFDNYFQGHSPASANHFKRLLGQTVVEPEALVTQPSLF